MVEMKYKTMEEYHAILVMRKLWLATIAQWKNVWNVACCFGTNNIWNCSRSIETFVVVGSVQPRHIGRRAPFIRQTWSRVIWIGMCCMLFLMPHCRCGLVRTGRSVWAGRNATKCGNSGGRTAPSARTGCTWTAWTGRHEKFRFV